MDTKIITGNEKICPLLSTIASEGQRVGIAGSACMKVTCEFYLADEQCCLFVYFAKYLRELMSNIIN